MPDIKSLREERSKLVHDARAIVDAAEADKREMTADESAQFDALMGKVDAKRSEIERLEKLTDAERELDAVVETRAREVAATGAKPSDRQMLAWRSWLANGRLGGNLSDEEVRAFQAASDTEGGYLVAPEQFVMQLIKFVDDAVHIRGLATIYQVSGNGKIGVPTLDTDAADSDWTTELLTGSEETTMRFGKRSMMPHPLAKRIKVSQTLLRVAAMPAEQIVLQRLAYKFAITQEKAYLTGNGVQKPLGVFTASTDGITTARDVSTDNAATAMTADGLINAKYALKAAYWNNATWMFHRDGVKQIAKLKDGEGQYLWREGMRQGEPDMLLGRPVVTSENAPSTFTTGQYVGILGDFSHYWIIDSLAMNFQRLVELYAETNQVGFIGRYEGDGMPVLAEAFVRVKLG